LAVGVATGVEARGVGVGWTPVELGLGRSLADGAADGELGWDDCADGLGLLESPQAAASRATATSVASTRRVVAARIGCLNISSSLTGLPSLPVTIRYRARSAMRRRWP